MNVALINGSPKGENSCSKKLLEVIRKYIDKDNNIYKVSVVDKRIKDVDKIKLLSNCDKIVIAFPLYVDCLPSIVIKFLENFEKYTKDNNIQCNWKLYCIVNCGFYEGIQNRQALMIIKNFTKHIEKLKYCGGIGIGTGPFIGNTYNFLGEEKIKSVVNDKLNQFIKAINNGETMSKDLFVEASVNKKLYIKIASFSWIKSAIKNKVYLDKINNKPYKE